MFLPFLLARLLPGVQEDWLVFSGLSLPFERRATQLLIALSAAGWQETAPDSQVPDYGHAARWQAGSLAGFVLLLPPAD